jgi:DNA-binding phage protein
LEVGAGRRLAESEALRPMTVARETKETVQARVRGDRRFREALLTETIECLLSGDAETGKSVLRDYVHATVGFEALARATQKSSKSLMRMLGPDGNPQASNLFAILKYLQVREGIRLTVTGVRS